MVPTGRPRGTTRSDRTSGRTSPSVVHQVLRRAEVEPRVELVDDAAVHLHRVQPDRVGLVQSGNHDERAKDGHHRVLERHRGGRLGRERRSSGRDRRGGGMRLIPGSLRGSRGGSHRDREAACQIRQSTSRQSRGLDFAATTRSTRGKHFQTRTRDKVEHESFRSFSIGRYDEFPKTAHPKRRGDRDATPYPLARALDEDGLARLASWKSRRIAVSLVEPAAEFPRLPRHDASPIHRGAPRGGRPGPHL